MEVGLALLLGLLLGWMAGKNSKNNNVRFS